MITWTSPQGNDPTTTTTTTTTLLYVLQILWHWEKLDPYITWQSIYECYFYRRPQPLYIDAT